MTVISAQAMETHAVFGARFTGMVGTRSGATELKAWRTEVPPGAPAKTHQVTREEIVVVLAGQARVHLDGRTEPVAAGDAVVVAAGVDFAIENRGEGPLSLLAIMPIEGQARIDGKAQTLPWMR